MALPPIRPPLRGGGPPPPSGSEDAFAKARREKDQIESECQQLEEELEELKAKYDQYFLGVERKAPVRQREELRKRVMRAKEAFTRNTGLKFRLQTLHARYLSYERLWMRSAREKEEGTYRRDLFKARLRAHKEEPAASAPEKQAASQHAASHEDEPASAPPVAAKAPAPAAPMPRSPAPRPTATAAGMKEADMRALFDAYVSAKKRCNEDVSRLTYDAVVKSVSKQIPELIARYKAKSVEFKVEVKDGKTVLKAVPKV